jgi:hypothetical protein
MAEREQADIERDMLGAIEEEDHAQQEQDVVVAGDHVLGAEIDERQQMDAGYLLNVSLVALGDGMSQERRRRQT